ncbi:MAG: ABC transporter ATP-binding protein [Leptospiraceae bacterium]|nr:ABC transporter ATP-binding protein [Leptospiraceae bacterium]
MSQIEVKNLSKFFYQAEYEIKALDNVTINIEKAEFTALVGPSGSGKTTLLNAIGALDKPTSGEITINGTKLSELNKNQISDYRLHHIGFVFQAYNLIPVLTAFENVEYVLQLQKFNKTDRRNKVDSLFKEIGLENLSDRFPRELSGGQQQRVAVARALIAQPDVVLADEPTANLDSENSEKLLSLMEQLCEQKGITFLFSTHDERVMRRAKRLIKLQDGKIV